MKFLRHLMTVLALACITSAHGAVFNVVAPPAPVAIGAEVRLNLVVLNPDASPLTLELPPVIKGSLCDDTHCWPVELVAPALGNPVTVAAGGFAVREYLFTLPRQALGVLVLDIAEPAAARVAIEARTGLAPAAPVAAPLSNFVPPQTAEAAIHRTFAGRFSAHEPIYFIYGEGPQAAKFSVQLQVPAARRRRRVRATAACAAAVVFRLHATLAVEYRRFVEPVLRHELHAGTHVRVAVRARRARGEGAALDGLPGRPAS